MVNPIHKSYCLVQNQYQSLKDTRSMNGNNKNKTNKNLGIHSKDSKPTLKTHLP